MLIHVEEIADSLDVRQSVTRSNETCPRHRLHPRHRVHHRHDSRLKPNAAYIYLKHIYVIYTVCMIYSIYILL